MHSFSSDFLNGLETKSENFQNNFYGIIDKICDYAKYWNSTMKKVDYGYEKYRSIGG